MISLRSNRLIAIVLITGLCGLGAAYSIARDAQSDEWNAPARAARKKNPIAADEKSIAVGRDVYAHQCLSCHGSSGHGDGPAAKDLDPKPHDLAAPKVSAQTDGALFWKLTEGKKPMPSFEKLISEDERWHVINFVRTFAASKPGTQQGQ